MKGGYREKSQSDKRVGRGKENYMIKQYIKLCKVKISLFSVFSAVAGFLVSSFQMEGKIIVVILGVFCLASGSSALNQVQEKDIDKLMRRTRNRPIPAGKIHPLHALYFSVVLICLGIFVLYEGASPAVSALGLCAVIWYNGVYTYLKRRSPFAIIPGSLIGAIPPAIGWLAGGSSPLDPKLFAFCLFFFFWQIPHFWLFLLNYGNEYKEAGLPSVKESFGGESFLRIIFHWIVATAVFCLLIPIYGLVHYPPVMVALLGSSSWLIWQGIRLIRGNSFDKSVVFTKVNHFMFVVLFLLSIDGLHLHMAGM
jgi:protoheme IX farnesyltransferase